jgi:hypothetical protein
MIPSFPREAMEDPLLLLKFGAFGIARWIG